MFIRIFLLICSILQFWGCGLNEDNNIYLNSIFFNTGVSFPTVDDFTNEGWEKEEYSKYGSYNRYCIPNGSCFISEETIDTNTEPFYNSLSTDSNIIENHVLSFYYYLSNTGYLGIFIDDELVWSKSSLDMEYSEKDSIIITKSGNVNIKFQSYNYHDTGYFDRDVAVISHIKLN